MAIIKDGHSSMYGHCWIEQDGSYYYVYVSDGKSKFGPFSSFADAAVEFNRWC